MRWRGCAEDHLSGLFLDLTETLASVHDIGMASEAGENLKVDALDTDGSVIAKSQGRQNGLGAVGKCGKRQCRRKRLTTTGSFIARKAAAR